MFLNGGFPSFFSALIADIDLYAPYVFLSRSLNVSLFSLLVVLGDNKNEAVVVCSLLLDRLETFVAFDDFRAPNSVLVLETVPARVSY